MKSKSMVALVIVVSIITSVITTIVIRAQQNDQRELTTPAKVMLNLKYKVREHPIDAKYNQLVIERENVGADDSMQVYITVSTLERSGGKVATRLLTKKEISTTIPTSTLGMFKNPEGSVIQVTFHKGEAFAKDVTVELPSRGAGEVKIHSK